MIHYLRKLLSMCVVKSIHNRIKSQQESSLKYDRLSKSYKLSFVNPMSPLLQIHTSSYVRYIQSGIKKQYFFHALLSIHGIPEVSARTFLCCLPISKSSDDQIYRVPVQIHLVKSLLLPTSLPCSYTSPNYIPNCPSPQNHHSLFIVRNSGIVEILEFRDALCHTFQRKEKCSKEENKNHERIRWCIIKHREGFEIRRETQSYLWLIMLNIN